MDLAAFVFLELDQATARATVAQAFHSLADISSKVLVRQNGGGASDRSLIATPLPGRPAPRRSGVAALGAELAPLRGVPRPVSFWRSVRPAGTLGATAIARQAVCGARECVN